MKRETPIVEHAADRLLDAIDHRGGPVCVGLDPVWHRLPPETRAGRETAESGAAALREFSLRVVDAVQPYVPAVKVQSACYERYGATGVAARDDVIAAAAAAGLMVILDAKRGDIAVSAEHYAAAAFGGHAGGGGGADWITLHGSLGLDAIAPFLDEGFGPPGRGVFILVRTSNPSGDTIQTLPLADGRTVAEAVADAVKEWGAARVGRHGYSDVGAVVGATKASEMESLRERMPEQIWLVPGFGAQGGTIDDIRPCFDARGRGALITSSRSVIYAFADRQGPWQDAVAEAAQSMAGSIAAVVGCS